MNFKKRVVKHIVKSLDLRIWGAEIELPIPSEFLITAHAEERMLQRFGCNKTKIKKVAVKAWYSKEQVRECWIERKKATHKRCIYKYFCGYIFVFKAEYHKMAGQAGQTQKVLITVFHPTKMTIV